MCLQRALLITSVLLTSVEPTPSWLWAVIGVAVGLTLALALAVVLVTRKVRRSRTEREVGERVRHRSTVTDNGEGGAKTWAQHTPHRERRGRVGREKDRNGMKKKKKAKEAEKKRRREPLGEDAIRMR